MKYLPLTISALVLSLCSHLLAGETNQAWEWQQAINVPSAGLYQIQLPNETLNASSESLKDIRMMSPDGVETPYFIDRTQQPKPAQQKAAKFESAIIDQTTILTARTQTDQPFSAITLQTPSREFIKPVKVETKSPSGEWKTVAENEVIFRETNGISRLRIPIKGNGYQEIRVSIDDSRSTPIPFTGIRLTIQGVKLPTQKDVAKITKQEQVDKISRLKINLGARNQHIAHLTLDVADAVFSRRYSLYYWEQANNKPKRKVIVSDGSIYSVQLDPKSTTKQLALPIQRIVPSDTLVLDIQNADSPALRVEPSVKVDSHPTKLVFYARDPGAWTLRTGYPNAQTPRYDLGAIRSFLSKPAKTIASGAITRNPTYQKPPALPEIQPQGADIDLSDWAYRRAIEAPPNGLIQIFLDPPTLALSQSDLADIRVIQNGKQLPFLIDRSHQTHTVDTTVETTLDSPQPNTSAYKIKQPHDQLPVDKLIITSDTPLFDRTLSILVDIQDSYGNTRRSYVKHQRWVKTTNNPASQSLSIDLSGHRMSEAFIIESPNGDNPPISITSVKLVTAKPSVTFKRLSAAPVFLYYGNPSASAPNYDLGLIRHELESVEKQAGTAGAKETIIPQPTPKGILSTGSPWLWAALGLVVVTLLIVVSKLLPKLPEESSSE